MIKKKKLSNNLYVAPLEYGEIDMLAGHSLSIYLIAEKVCDEEYLRKQALQLVVAGCSNFNIYGTFQEKWGSIIETVSKQVFYHNNEKTREVKIYKTVQDFATALNVEHQTRSFVPHIIYLIYDDFRIYSEVLSTLDLDVSYECCFHHNSICRG